MCPADPKRPTLDEFARMVERHDPTYIWSRNKTEREAGEHERRMIDRVREILGDELVVPVWNRAMRKKVVPSMIEDFLWRVRREKNKAKMGVAV